MTARIFFKGIALLASYLSFAGMIIYFHGFNFCQTIIVCYSQKLAFFVICIVLLNRNIINNYVNNIITGDTT